MIPDWVAYTVTQILEQNVLYGTGTRANFGRPAAGKTGTTDDHADAWFCGYLPNLQATVWVGYPQGEIPMQNVHGIAVAGGSFPAEIWRRVHGAGDAVLAGAGLLAPEDLSELDVVAAGPVRHRLPADEHVHLHDHDDDAGDDRAATTVVPTQPTTTRPQTTTQSVTIPVEPTTTVGDDAPPPATAPPSTTIAPPPTTTEVTTTQPARSRRVSPRRVALRVTALVTPVLLGALAVPSGGLFRGAKFRDLHVYRQYGDALLAGHVPYRDFFVEYPPEAIPLSSWARCFRVAGTTRPSRF